MSYAIVFPGQGTQYAAMLPWLESEAGRSEALLRLNQSLGADWRVHLTEPEWSIRNDVAQPLLTGTCLAAWEAVRPLLPTPTAAAGYSIGEVAAFAAAGVFGVGDAMELAGQRAAAMDTCLGGRRTGLLSITGASGESVENWCRRHGLDIAIRIATDRCIVGGGAAALAAAEADALCASASCKRLPVALASHTPWLADAVAPFRRAIDAFTFAPPRMPVVCNRTGTALRGAAELRDALATQIAHTLQWERCMDTLAERRVRCVLEVGPGSTLSKMWNERHPSIPARSLDEFRATATAATWVREHTAA